MVMHLRIGVTTLSLVARTHLYSGSFFEGISEGTLTADDIASPQVPPNETLIETFPIVLSSSPVVVSSGGHHASPQVPPI